MVLGRLGILHARIRGFSTLIREASCTYIHFTDNDKGCLRLPLVSVALTLTLYPGPQARCACTGVVTRTRKIYVKRTDDLDPVIDSEESERIARIRRMIARV